MSGQPAKHDFLGGLWRLADPKITLASLSSMFLGACAAAADAPLSWPWLALTVAGIFAIEVAKNASGEIFDFDSGTDLLVSEEDASPFSGGKRVLVDGLLTRLETIAIAAGCYAAGSLAGLWIAWEREPAVLLLGAVGVGCAYFYHAPPLALSYRGLGELAVGICYGPLICMGTHLVQSHRWSGTAFFASLPLGLLIASFLWICEFPDCQADAAAGKRTLVTRLGRRASAPVLAGLLATAYGAVAAIAVLGLAKGIWLGAAGLPLAVRAAMRVSRSPERTRDIVPAQAEMLAAFVLYALGAGIGMAAGL